MSKQITLQEARQRLNRYVPSVEQRGMSKEEYNALEESLLSKKPRQLGEVGYLKQLREQAAAGNKAAQQALREFEPKGSSLPQTEQIEPEEPSELEQAEVAKKLEEAELTRAQAANITAQTPSRFERLLTVHKQEPAPLDSSMARDWANVPSTASESPERSEILHEASHSVYDEKHGLIASITGDQIEGRLPEDYNKVADVDERVLMREEPIDGHVSNFELLREPENYNPMTGRPQDMDYNALTGTKEEQQKVKQNDERDRTYNAMDGTPQEEGKRKKEAENDSKYSFLDGDVKDQTRSYNIMTGYSSKTKGLNSLDAKVARQRAKLSNEQKRIEVLRLKDAYAKASQTEKLLKQQRRTRNVSATPTSKRKREPFL